MLTLQEVERHASRQSCWVVISGHVYDVTDFLDEHPGGAGIILRYGGKVMIHPSPYSHSTLTPHRMPPRRMSRYTHLACSIQN